MRGLVLLLVLLGAGFVRGESDRPRLVVFVTIDQLRGDMLPRFAGRFEAGLRDLLSEGTHYRNAHFRHATTFTGSGHATLFTGANPNGHGVTGNDWYDAASGVRIYCVEDDRYRVLGEEQRPHAGTSPRNLIGGTIGDELIIASGGQAKVVAVSVKDRGAILPAGQLGKAYWYETTHGGFTSSTYYHDALPDWATRFNETRPIDAWAGKAWTLSRPEASYTFADARDWELPTFGLGQTFPHPLPAEPGKALYSAARYTPIADRATVDFALAAVAGERLGQRGVTDLLAISLSGTDYIGHAFGPNSREAEENLLALDATLGHLLAGVERLLGGREDVLVVFSADHGVDTIPEYREQAGRAQDSVPLVATDAGMRMFDEEVYGSVGAILRSGRHFPTTFVELLNRQLAKRFAAGGPLVAAFWNPCLYLDEQALVSAGLDRATVERALAEEVRRIPGFAAAFTYADLAAGTVPDGPLVRYVQASFHPERSGSVFVVQKPHWYLYGQARANAAMHGSPYAYDRHVPVIFHGWRVAAREVERHVLPESIVVTLARMLNLPCPANACDEPLVEVLSR